MEEEKEERNNEGKDEPISTPPAKLPARMDRSGLGGGSAFSCIIVVVVVVEAIAN